MLLESQSELPPLQTCGGFLQDDQSGELLENVVQSELLPDHRLDELGRGKQIRIVLIFCILKGFAHYLEWISTD